jgi:hypothetical protein
MSDFQDRVGAWMLECFGADITDDIRERGYRFFEEAGELCQALGMTEDMAHRLVTYTWSREIGEPAQEVGGVMVTMGALCNAAKLDMHAEGEIELARISQPDLMLKVRAKHAAKTLRSRDSALPGAAEIESES